MMKQLFQFNGSATRKDWWITTLLTALSAALLLSLLPSLRWSGLGLLLLLPWLAVSARRMHCTGNDCAPCLFSFGGVAVLLAVLPLLSDSVRAVAAPFAQLLLLIGGIVALSYMVICGFVGSTKRA